MPIETHQPHVAERRLGNMRFVIVNGRTPRGKARCAVCCEEIGDRYVREIPTGLIHCNRHHGAGYSQISEVASRFRARVVS